MTFERFVAIDWSGARGHHLPGLAVAIVEDDKAAPRLVPPPAGKAWSREEVAEFIAAIAGEGQTLIGADFSFSLPYMDQGCYFPGMNVCSTATDLWQLIETVCEGDDHLYGGAFVASDDYARYFRRPGRVGHAFSPRLRLTEARCRDAGFGPAESAYHLIGPAQVGLGSLSGMRLLAALDGVGANLAVWPFAMPAPGQSCLVEMYTRLFLNRAGVVRAKVRDRVTLDAALDRLGSAPWSGNGSGPLSDHQTDVLVSAAGLRHMVRNSGPIIWNPPGLSDKVRLTEGWTFGVV
jgi:hypothetical protein